MYDTDENNLERLYRISATIAGLVAILSGSTLLTIITRQIPELIIGGLFVQVIPLIISIGLFLFTANKTHRFLAFGLFGAIIFSLIGGWWDAFYLFLLSFSIGQVTGFNIFVTSIVIVISALVDKIKGKIR